jgi:hypothetical protein
MNKTKSLLLVILLTVFLSACRDGTTPQPSASATSEFITPTLPAALPTTRGTLEDLTTAQPAATLSPVFDLTRTETNPITDTQQIIEILEALESTRHTQLPSPGWYLKTDYDLTDSENSERVYFLYHVIDDEVNCDLAMFFLLSPERNTLVWMTRNYGTPIQGLQSEEIALWENMNDTYYCNLSNPNLYFYSDDADDFSNTVQGWIAPGAEQYGNNSFSAWFETEEDETFFILQEETTNIQSDFQTDPDTKKMVAVRSREKIDIYSLATGTLVSYQSTINLANDKTVVISSFIQEEYYPEMAELPPSVFTYLEKMLETYNELQTP